MNKVEKLTFVMSWHITERAGGAEVQANYLAVELVKRGYKVSYICQTVKSDKVNTVDTINGVKIYWIKPARKLSWSNYPNYKKKLKITEPEVIIHRNSSSILYTSKRYKNKFKTKLIWICTDNLAPFKDFYKQRFIAKNSIKSAGFLKFIIYYLNSLLEDRLRNFGMKGIDIGFSQNSFQSKRIKDSFNLITFKMISGHHPQNDEIISDKRFHDKVVLWCANFGKHKRPELFIELANNMLETNYKFIMIGGHNDEVYVNKLLKNKSENLDVIGHLPFDEVFAYFNKASVFVNTSISEGFSNTYIQSWLRGVPTLVFGADPNEVISKNNLGYNVDSIAEAKKMILNTLSNKEDFMKMSENVRHYANKNHTIKIMTDHFLNVLNENL